MAEERRSPSPNERMILYSEVEGLCPRCSLSLNYNKNGKKITRFDAAHIYPLNPTSEELELLSNVPRICSDVNDLKNFLALCKNCHREFDTPRTVEEYMELYELKKNILQYYSALESFQRYQIEDEITVVLKKLVEINDIELTELKYSAVKVDSKSDGTMNSLTKRQIKRHVVEYYLVVQAYFRELDNDIDDSFITIASQVKTFALKLKKEGLTQEEIYQTLVKWLSKRTGNTLLEACSIIISYFIQNCEVFNDSTR